MVTEISDARHREAAQRLAVAIQLLSQLIERCMDRHGQALRGLAMTGV